MRTKNCEELIKIASNIANDNGSKKIKSIHFLAGILYLEHLPVAKLLYKYGITLNWIEKHSLDKIKLKNEYCGNLSLPYNHAVDLIILFANTLASNKNLLLDVEHIAYVLLTLNSTTLKKVKENVENYSCLVSELLAIVNQDPVNQVLIE